MSAYHPASSIIPVSLDGPRAAWPRRGMAAACLLLISPYPWGGLDALLAVAVGGLTICLLVIRIGLAVREWRQN